nr:uncharacterized protein LOC109157754 [Ipomoea trifida]
MAGNGAVGVGSRRQLHGSDDFKSNNFSSLTRISNEVLANACPETVAMWRGVSPNGFRALIFPPFFLRKVRHESTSPTDPSRTATHSQDTMMKKLDAKIDKVAQSSQASIHNLEVQVGQLAKLVAEKDRGKFPSATEINPREGAMAVTLRSGKMFNEVLKEKEQLTVEKESDKEGEQLPKESSSDQNLNSSTVKPYVPPIPYP